MLRITTRNSCDELVLKLEGCLTGAWVDELEACWIAAKENFASARVVDLSEVRWVDEAGRQLLAHMHRSGARLVAKGCFMRELVREISESDDLAERE
jgi:anti-anti-sigma regulatory factor